MRRSELLRRASEQAGRPAKAHHLQYAQQLGHVDHAPVHAGWQKFDGHHLQQLVTYLKDHAREDRSQAK